MTNKKRAPTTIPGATPAENAIFSKKKFFLELKHLPSGDEIRFKAMLTQFEDQYTSDWNTEQTFGRMDPIKSFRGTQRMITLGWDLPAASIEEARFNLRNCSKFLSMLYPSYDTGAVTEEQKATEPETPDRQVAQDTVLSSKKDTLPPSNNAATIKGAPLFKLKFANLIQSAAFTSEANSNIESGLVGAIDGLTYSPDVDQGFFDPSKDQNGNDIAGILYPQTIRLSFGFFVTHDHPLGWSGSNFRAPGAFPYPKTPGDE